MAQLLGEVAEYWECRAAQLGDKEGEQQENRSRFSYGDGASPLTSVAFARGLQLLAEGLEERQQRRQQRRVTDEAVEGHWSSPDLRHGWRDGWELAVHEQRWSSLGPGRMMTQVVAVVAVATMVVRSESGLGVERGRREEMVVVWTVRMGEEEADGGGDRGDGGDGGERQ